MLPLALLLLAPAQPPVAPAPRPVGLDPALADWTPRPIGKEPWERATDKDWIDARFRTMDTGPVLNCTMDYPFGSGRQRVYKASVVRLTDGKGGAVFDRSTCQLAAAWTGGYLKHSDRRFGLLNTPTPVGKMLFASPSGPGWANPDGDWTPPLGRFTAPLPKEWVKYRGHYLDGDRVTWAFDVNGVRVHKSARPDAEGRLVCTLYTAPSSKPLVFRTPNGGVTRLSASDQGHLLPFVGDLGHPVNGTVSNDPTEPGPKRWGEPIVTKLVRGAETGPFAVDTLTIPYENRFGALFFSTGVDFLPDGRVAMCTCHGDVWLVRVDDAAGTCAWQRFATGLYHPLGLKVVAGKVVVLERGQLTRLHDNNGDGEADFYECVCNDWHTGGGEHSYDTCLETDPAGNFYFFKTGDTDTPSGGTLIKVSKDGSKAETFATGFRHPIGMGMSPTGILTGADQEGNWMPATRIDEYRQGGFYGDMRAHHRATPPKTFDPPLCWLPREVDNSAGGQVWVPANSFGPLAGKPLHFSYGRCQAFVLLRQELAGGRVQGGVAPLDMHFLLGSCRGRFHTDGSLYVCGLNGWQTAAKADGSLQRVRYTGKPLDVPAAMAVEGDTIRLSFTHPLDARTAADAARYQGSAWNYRWSGDYGSIRWKPSDPTTEGADAVPVRSAALSVDGKTLTIRFEKLSPVMQMHVGYNLTAADGRPVVGSVYLTIHSTEK
ncbi:DUF6797 domain-containing protein [Urbifossiella limnaea]|uniref:DUF6797 domain-containing protein n=1 Tax=Urbifossiella limnaea TaxID=2528023 RepID=A0A517XRV9_9BACT|nr:DUF6797 domain-containing protein [Urbifossiella limnaea]QDU20244.1 hypothetical protein ETAA1_21890 [Urbifossiella limnaea]